MSESEIELGKGKVWSLILPAFEEYGSFWLRKMDEIAWRLRVLRRSLETPSTQRARDRTESRSRTVSYRYQDPSLGTLGIPGMACRKPSSSMVIQQFHTLSQQDARGHCRSQLGPYSACTPCNGLTSNSPRLINWSIWLSMLLGLGAAMSPFSALPYLQWLRWQLACRPIVQYRRHWKEQILFF